MNDLPLTVEGMLKHLQEAPPERVQKYAEMVKPYLDRLWLPQQGPQYDAYHSEADELLYGGAAGGGKLSDVNELVLTPTGWVRIGDLKVGSSVCATDGTVATVIGMFPQGVKANYRVTFHDGTSCLAGLEHNWLGWWTGRGRKSGNQRGWGEASAQKWTTAEVIEGLARQKVNNRSQRFAIPVCDPVAFNLPGCPRKTRDGGHYVRRAVDPYLLGLLIGDGSLAPATRVALTSADADIGAWLLDRYGDDVAVDVKEGNQAKTYRFRGETLTVLREQLSSAYLGLAGHKAESKFIPHVYLFGSVAERWALLQGLMDTDGWADKDGDCYFCTVSPQLRDDVAHLARSLGCVVTVTEKAPTYTLNGEKFQGRTAYALRVKARDTTQLFCLPRKLERCGREPQSMAKYVASIEYSHDAESVCIAVRHPSSLYITRDFIVTHNTDLLIGLATTAHHKSLLFRRQSNDLDGLWSRLLDVAEKGIETKNDVKKVLKLTDGRVIEGGHLEKPGSEKSWQGRPHDLIGFDEGAQLDEYKVAFVTQWLRSVEGHRCRVVIATNPPIPEYIDGQLVDYGTGEWLKRWFGPWLDDTHPNPAKPGELRWCYMKTSGDRMETVWVSGPGYYSFETGLRVENPTETDIQNGAVLAAKSRTFIRSLLKDNAYLTGTGYAERISSSPEPLRTLLLTGKFNVRLEDTPMQVIPTAWVTAAQQRWFEREEQLNRLRQLVLSADVAQGGADNAIYAELLDRNTYAALHKHPGRETPDGVAIAGRILQYRRDGSLIVLDGTGGWAGDAYRTLESRHRIEAELCVASHGSGERVMEDMYICANVRTEMWWMFREALDPKSGQDVALPPDTRLEAQLTAPHWYVRGERVFVESKEELRKRLGSSTDEADAVIQAWRYREQAIRAIAERPTDIIKAYNDPEYDPRHPHTPKALAAADFDDPLAGW